MIDVLLATYNGEKYIKKQIDSILHQTRQDIRLFIRDDGSSDSTLDIINFYKNDSRVFILPDNQSSGSSKNNFIRLVKYLVDNHLDSSSQYVMFSDQDDVWNKDKIELTMNCMVSAEKKYGQEKPILVHTDLYVMDENEKIISDSLIEYMRLPKDDSLKSLLLQNSVTGCTIMMNKEALSLFAKVNENGKFVIHDHFAAILIAAFGEVICLDKSTIRYRQHSGNVIGASDAKSFSYMIKRFKRGKEKFRKDMDDCYIQAGYILSQYEDELDKMDPERLQLIREYSELYRKKASEKRKFFKKNNMYKCGRIKKIMQIVWC